MGFGTLFIGYFFILNFPYCEFTDAIAASLMLYGLYKLSGLNDWLRLSFFFTVGFAVLGVLELGLELYGMLFMPLASTHPVFAISALLRHLFVCMVTAFGMLGIKDVADEVGLSSLAEKAGRGAYVSIGIYSISILLESSSLASFIPARILATLYVFTVLATVTLVIFNLTCIYSAYMRICMPEDKDMEVGESRFEFVNTFRHHEEKKNREYAEYRIKKSLAKKEKKEKGKNNYERKKEQ